MVRPGGTLYCVWIDGNSDAHLIAFILVLYFRRKWVFWPYSHFIPPLFPLNPLFPVHLTTHDHPQRPSLKKQIPSIEPLPTGPAFFCPAVNKRKPVMREKKSLESVLVIVLAETRAHQHTFELFRKNVLDNFQADLCLCVADNEREDTSNPFYRHAKHVWRYPEPEDWGDAFDEAQRKSGLTGDWRVLLNIKDQWLGGVHGDGQHPGSAGILLFFRWFLKDRLQATGVIKQYDRFIVTRSDFVHRIPHAPLALLDPDYIWLPFGEDYGGYTDRHIIAGQQDILRVRSITDAILCEPEQLAAEMRPCAHWNLEQFIKFSFARQGLIDKVKRFPYTMYSVRPADGHTRWREGKFDQRLGYFIKYPDEFKRHRLARLLIREQGDWSAAKIRWLNRLVSWNDSYREMKQQLRRHYRKFKAQPAVVCLRLVEFFRTRI